MHFQKIRTFSPTKYASIEHAFRQSMPDTYGMGMGMLPGGMGINSLPGSQMLLYGRGMPYNVIVSFSCIISDR